MPVILIHAIYKEPHQDFIAKDRKHWLPFWLQVPSLDLGRTSLRALTRLLMKYVDLNAFDLIEELRRAELDDDFVSPVLAAASQSTHYHLFWDDADKLKLTDFKTEVLFDLVDSLYRRKHGLTVTSNYSMRDLIERERMHPAIVRRLDDMCRAVEL